MFFHFNGSYDILEMPRRHVSWYAFLPLRYANGRIAFWHDHIIILCEIGWHFLALCHHQRENNDVPRVREISWRLVQKISKVYNGFMIYTHCILGVGRPIGIFRCYSLISYNYDITQMSRITKFMGPTWGPHGSCRPQMGPMLAPWTLLSVVLIRRMWNDFGSVAWLYPTQLASNQNMT